MEGIQGVKQGWFGASYHRETEGPKFRSGNVPHETELGAPPPKTLAGGVAQTGKMGDVRDKKADWAGPRLAVGMVNRQEQSQSFEV